jgi:hypothetical protein
MQALLSKTTLGLLVALGLVLLFYARMLGEAQDTLTKVARKKAEDEVKKQETKATEAQRHRELVSALRATQRLGASDMAASGGTNSAATDSGNQPKSTTDSTPGSQMHAAPDNQTAQRTALPANLISPQATQPGAQPWGTVALLLWLGAAAYLGYAGWRESTRQLIDADPNDRDTQLLELLMGAFAGVIGRALPIPRQVKRFASKARLQHNLLGQLADETRQTSRFSFDAAQQVLAFLLLLLLEDRAAPASGRAAPLRELDEDDFVVSLRERFLAWHRTNADSRVYARFEQRAYSLAVPTYADLPDLLNEAESDRLLIQLHRLNAGLLV